MCGLMLKITTNYSKYWLKDSIEICLDSEAKYRLVLDFAILKLFTYSKTETTTVGIW